MERTHEGDPWSNLTIDFGADFGMDNKSEAPLEETEIFGNNLLEVVGDFLPHNKFVTPKIELPLSAGPLAEDSSKCPCCAVKLESNAVSSHAHVKSCFLKKQKGKGQRANLTSTAMVDSIRSSVGKMDLRRRINLMESLDRLATMSNKKSHQHQSALSARGQKSDHRVLSLLYSSTPSPASSPVHPSASELFTPMGACDKIFEYASLLTRSEANTPPLNPLLDPSYKTFTPLASPISIKPTPRAAHAMKKRKITQALSYSPKRRYSSMVTNVH